MTSLTEEVEKSNLVFVNRLDEIRELVSSYAPPYYVVQAPAGYGKTTLLKEAQRRFREKSWKCAYVSVQRHRSLSAIVQELVSESQLGLMSSAADHMPTDPKTAGQQLGEAIKKHWNGDVGLVLLIDVDGGFWASLELLVADLLTDFIPGLEKALRDSGLFQGGNIHSPFRVILAGRYLRYRLGGVLDSLPFNLLQLTPFSYKPIRDATQAFLGLGSLETVQVAAHIMHYAAGHPRCMARVLEMYKIQTRSPDEFFRECADEVLDTVVSEAEEVRRNVPAELLGHFDALSIFRYLDFKTLDMWLDELNLDSEHRFEDRVELVEGLSKSDLMSWDRDLLRDAITRRLMATRLLRETGFTKRCQQSRKVCQEYLQEESAQRPHLWAIESLFQLLQEHTENVQDAEQRMKLGDIFFGAVPEVLALLFDGRNPKEQSSSLTRALEDDKEFQFTMNYYLRKDQYNTDPYDRLLGQEIDKLLSEQSREGGQGTMGLPLEQNAPAKESYMDFHLHIDSNGNIRAKSSEGERTGTISLDIPINVALTMKLIERNQTDEDLLKEFGKQLYQFVFPGSIHTHFNQTEAVAREREQKVRIRLTIDPDELAHVPWEFIYREEGGHFLAVHPDTVFAHYLDLPVPANRVRRRKGPLDLLLIIANPSDQSPLDPDKWEQIVTKALTKPLEERTLSIRTVKQATRSKISDALLEQSPDIVQFVGHGIYQKGKGYLALVDGNTGKTWEVDDARFANIFLGAGDHLGLVSLATCESAQSDSPRSFLGIAPKIVQRGVPAVVAMQYSVLVSTAEIFLEEFYKAVAAGKPVDWAVQWARNQISQDKELNNREFATPVLYMRAEDGNIF